jgi:hypothetical protein
MVVLFVHAPYIGGASNKQQKRRRRSGVNGGQERESFSLLCYADLYRGIQTHKKRGIRTYDEI